MSVKPDFAAMNAKQLRSYILAHREDEEALQAYFDKLHSENSNTQFFKAEEDVSVAITEYLKTRR